MAGKGYRTWSHSVLSSVLLLVVLVLVNVVMARASSHLDLTEEGLYTLDTDSRKIVANLRDPLALTVFWGGLPTRFEATRSYVEGLLDEIEDASSGKITVRWYDTDTDAGKKEASKNNIQEEVYGANEGSRQVRQSGYMTLLIESGAAEPALIPHVGTMGTALEYTLLVEIDKRSRETPARIGVVVPDSPLFLNNSMARGQPPGRFGYLKGVLHRFHDKSLVVIDSIEEPVPADISVLLVVAPWQVSEVSAYHLEQFALRGGRLLLLMDQVNIENTVLARQEREPRSSGLEDWLTHLGVTVEYGFVGDFDPKNQAINNFMQAGRGAYPYFPKVTSDHTDNDILAFATIPSFPMCWPSVITVDDEAQQQAGRTSRVLARTSAAGHRRAEIGAVGSTLRFPTPPARELESLPLIVLLEGPMSSFWKGKGRPLSPGEMAAEAARMAEAEALAAKAKADAAAAGSDDPDDKDPGDEKPPAKDESAAGSPDGDGDEGGDGADEDTGPVHLDEGKVKILILGDAELCADYMRPDPRLQGRVATNGAGGFLLVAGMTQWLSGTENLLALRARNVNSRLLGDITPETKKTIQWVNLGTVPFLLLCIGLVVFAVRRSQRS